MQSVRYDRHHEEWDRALGDGDFGHLAKTWMREDNLDYWCHTQIRAAVKPFVENNADASWLTVGDGRYGADAHYLITLGAKQVHASDMHDTLLRVGSEQGFISDYSAQNAERLTFPDDSFDYVYCKEAFHHFPRPYVALYEMFRVARIAVILTEPRDEVLHHARCKSLIKAVLRKSENGHSFEPIGNYVYTVSERELEKFLLGMHYRHIAFHGCNTFYIEGIEFVPSAGGTGQDKRKRAMLKAAILAMDALEKVGLHSSSLLSAALFKQEPPQRLREQLEAAKWKLKELPRNPYLSPAEG